MPPTTLCPDEALQGATRAATRSSRTGLRQVDELLKQYPEDPRLLFLKGSLLAALKKYAEAVEPMTQALGVAPGYHVARFQLGLLHLSSGAPEAALQVWGPLAELEPKDPLRLFSEGLRRMVEGAFDATRRLLREGMVRNLAFPEINKDMQLVLEQLPPEGAPSEASSEAQWLLQADATRQTKH